MKDFLRKIKVIQSLRTELKIEKSVFIEKFLSSIEIGDTDPLSSMFDMFKRSKKEYKGSVKFDTFEIKRLQRMFSANMNMVSAKGKFYQKDDTLVIETEVNGFHRMMIFYYGFLIFVYGFTGLALSFQSPRDFGPPLILVPFIIVHAALMFGLPYFLMRRSVKRFTYDLEREFFYMTK